MTPVLCKAKDTNYNTVYGQPFPVENGVVFIEAETLQPIEIMPDSLQVPLYWQDKHGNEIYDQDNVQVEIFRNGRRVSTWGRVKACGNENDVVCLDGDENDEYLLANCDSVEVQEW